MESVLLRLSQSRTVPLSSTVLPDGHIKRFLVPNSYHDGASHLYAVRSQKVFALDPHLVCLLALSLQIAGVFESIQPSDTDLGAKAPKDVKITGLWYGQLIK